MKLYVLVRDDLPPGLQVAQAVHAAVDLTLAVPHLVGAWAKWSNNVVVLSVSDEAKLKDWALFLGAIEPLTVVEVREPDLDYQMTALAIEPHPMVAAEVAGLPLALSG